MTHCSDIGSPKLEAHKCLFQTAKCIFHISGWWLFILWVQQMVWVERKLHTATLVWSRRNSNCLTNFLFFFFFYKANFLLKRACQVLGRLADCQASKPMMDARLLSDNVVLQDSCMNNDMICNTSPSFFLTAVWILFKRACLKRIRRLTLRSSDLIKPPTGSTFLSYQGLDIQSYVCPVLLLHLSLHFTEKKPLIKARLVVASKRLCFTCFEHRAWTVSLVMPIPKPGCNTA